MARVFGAEMTGDPAMLASGCEEDIEVMPRRDKRMVNHFGMVIFTCNHKDLHLGRHHYY